LPLAICAEGGAMQMTVDGVEPCAASAPFSTRSNGNARAGFRNLMVRSRILTGDETEPTLSNISPGNGERKRFVPLLPNANTPSRA